MEQTRQRAGKPGSRRRRPIQLAALRGFELAARRLSFTQAGDELALTQSSISRQIATLERQIGKPLFVRKTRALELTLAGAQLLGAVTPALDAIDRCVEQIRGLDTAPRVSLSTYASFASLWLVPRLAAFQFANPRIEVRIDASDRLVDLAAEGMDIALRRCRPQQVAGLPCVTELWEEFATPALSPQLLERTGITIDEPAALYRLPLIEMEDEYSAARGTTWAGWFEFARAPTQQPSAGRLMVSFVDQAIQAAVRGQGVVLGLYPLVEESISSGQLSMPFPALRMATGARYYLMVNPASSARPEVATFVDWLLDAFKLGPQRSS